MKGQIPIHLTIEINLKFLNVYAMYVMLFIVHVLKEFPSSTLLIIKYFQNVTTKSVYQIRLHVALAAVRKPAQFNKV